MTLGYHLILSAYGFWLPNDPRGSWSHVVRSFELLKYGPATKTDATQSVAHVPHNIADRLAAKASLTRSPVQFNGMQARAITCGISTAIHEKAYVVPALAILPDHVHLIVRRHDRDIAKIAIHIKAKATMAMAHEGLHPCAPLPNGTIPTPWARNFWAPYIKSREHMDTAIEYVRRNPMKAGLKEQNWKLVVPFE